MISAGFLMGPAMAYGIYGDKGSGAFAVEAALAEAGCDYRFEAISLEKNEQRSEAFRAINPSGKIPALKLPSGEIVTESSALLLTVADRYPEAKLLPPSASAARADAYRWIAFMASEIYPMVEIVDYPERFTPDGADKEIVRGLARERVRERFRTIESVIAVPWLLPSGFSAADIYAAMFSRWSVGKDWRETNLPKVNALARSVSERPRIAAVWQKHFGAA
jgi:glutathione S-transferase